MAVFPRTRLAGWLAGRLTVSRDSQLRLNNSSLASSVPMCRQRTKHNLSYIHPKYNPQGIMGQALKAPRTSSGNRRRGGGRGGERDDDGAAASAAAASAAGENGTASPAGEVATSAASVQAPQQEVQEAAAES